MSATPPIAKQLPHRTTHHGITRDDPYHWLRADNWQEVMQAPETLTSDIREDLEAENADYESAFGKPTEALRETLYREIRGRMKEDDSGVPTPDGPYAYNSRTETGKQYPLLVRTPRTGGCRDPPARRAAPDLGEQADPVVGHEGRAGLPVTVDDVQHSRWQRLRDQAGLVPLPRAPGG